MESLNVLKGYEKVDFDLEESPPPTTTTSNHHRFLKKTTHKPFLIALSIVALLASTLLLAFMITILIHNSNVENSPSHSADSLRIICNVTQYPQTCFNSISSLNVDCKPDPLSIFKLSLVVSIQDVKSMSLFLRSVNDVNSHAAVDDCLTQFDDALSLLNDSVSAMEKMLTFEKINDIQTWVSAAMTDEDTCVEGLEELGSKMLDEVKNKMERSKENLSNSLSIIVKMQSLLENFGCKMH